jgi:hypothetical protein
MKDVASMRAYLADPERAAQAMRHELQETLRQHLQGAAAESQEEREDSSSSSATITFQLSPEAIAEDRERPFPPNPWRIPVN